MLMTYESTAGLTTVGYRIVNDDKTEDTALTTTGVTEIQSGGYGVNLADAKAGKTIQWYEGSTYQVSERIPYAAPDNAGIADAKAAAEAANAKLPSDTTTKLAKLDAAVSTRAASTGMAGVDATTTGNLSVTRGTDATLTFDGDFTGTYSLTITPVGATTAALTKTGSWGSGEVQVTLSDTETTALTGGLYEYRMRVTEGSTTTLSHEGLVIVTS